MSDADKYTGFIPKWFRDNPLDAADEPPAAYGVTPGSEPEEPKPMTTDLIPSRGWAAVVTMTIPFPDREPLVLRYLGNFGHTRSDVWDSLHRQHIAFLEKGEMPLTRTQLQAKMRGRVKLVRAKVVIDE